jgi:aminoglycoside phosphotransferase (APT) family kinase protein
MPEKMFQSESIRPMEKTIENLLSEIAPGSKLISINDLPGSYSNFTHLIKAKKEDDSIFQFIVRRYAIHGSYNLGEKARREYKTYQILKDSGVPVPQPIFLDESGTVLGIPGIVTNYLPGKLNQLPTDPIEWVRKLAKALAKIHSIEIIPEENTFLMNANEEAIWFLRYGTVPGFMKTHPLGEIVWNTINDKYSNIIEIEPKLIHLDYWPGNVLWEENEITGVIDWEEAAYGDPAIDVAYLKMNLIIDGYYEAADEFIGVYEKESGQNLENLRFWELAAAARPMIDLEDWNLNTPPKRDRFEQFIKKAIEGINNGSSKQASHPWKVVNTK